MLKIYKLWEKLFPKPVPVAEPVASTVTKSVKEEEPSRLPIKIYENQVIKLCLKDMQLIVSEYFGLSNNDRTFFDFNRETYVVITHYEHNNLSNYKEYYNITTLEILNDKMLDIVLKHLGLDKIENSMGFGYGYGIISADTIIYTVTTPQKCKELL